MGSGSLRLAGKMRSVADVSVSVVHFIALEVRNLVEVICGVGLVAFIWGWALIAMLWFEAVVYMAMEVIGTVKPRAGADEDATSEPLRAVIAIRSAGVWCVIVVAIWALRRYANVDGDLGSSLWCCRGETKRGNCCRDENAEFFHGRISLFPCCPQLWCGVFLGVSRFVRSSQLR